MKPEFDPQVILTRVAEYQIAAGQTVQADQTFMKALDCELALNLATPEANAAFAEAKLKHEDERSRRYGGSIDDAFNRGRGAVSSSFGQSDSSETKDRSSESQTSDTKSGGSTTYETERATARKNLKAFQDAYNSRAPN